MVKQPCRPGDGVVTAGANVVEVAFVGVIFGMAGVAAGLGGAESPGFVAAVALVVGMLA